MKILIIEDDNALADVLVRGLKEEQFAVDRAPDGDSGLSMALAGEYDCLILDIMLPGIDGVEVCRRLRREQYHVPIIMLTVKNEVADRVQALEAGADDYVAKPFSFDELLARIRAQIRRNSVFSGEELRHGDLELDAKTLTALRSGVVTELTPKEYQLLSYFIRHSGRVVTEKELIENVWGLTFDPQTNVVNVYLHRLRGKLHIDGRGPVIKTIRGKGYRLGEPV